MGKIDTQAKQYMGDNARFADAFNYFIYGGKQVIDPAALTELDTTEIVIPYGNKTKAPVQKFRDLLKSITGSRLTIDEQEDKVDMCQAIDDLRRDSIQEGIGIGIGQGIEQGIELNRLESIRNLMGSLKCTAQQAMDYLIIPASERQKYLSKL